MKRIVRQKTDDWLGYLSNLPYLTSCHLIDSTLIVMHTELDREQWHQPGDALGRPYHSGTNHAETTSILMAGMGVQGGELIGGTHRVPKDFARFPKSASYDYLLQSHFRKARGTAVPRHSFQPYSPFSVRPFRSSRLRITPP